MGHVGISKKICEPLTERKRRRQPETVIHLLKKHPERQKLRGSAMTGAATESSAGGWGGGGGGYMLGLVTPDPSHSMM